MKEGREIWWISIPFALGVGAGAVCGGGYVLSSSACLASGLVLAAFRKRPRNAALAVLLFLLLGFFCYCSTVLCGAPRIGLSRMPAKRLSEFLDSIGFPHAGTAPLLKALLTGQRDLLGRGTVEAFRTAGAAHLLALSGLHLGVIYSIMRKALAPLGHSRSAELSKSLLIIALCAVYAFETGASPSIVRAFLFILINEISRLAPDRKRRPLTVLLSALTVQLLFNPQVISSLGFQLSYLAMLGLYTVFPALDALYPEADGFAGRMDPMRRIWTSVSMTLSCQIFTAPLVYLRLHTFPRHFLLTNLLALPQTELLIFSSVLMILAKLSGICPDWLPLAVDTLAEALQRSLGIISEM